MNFAGANAWGLLAITAPVNRPYLKILNGLIKPDEGKVTIKGRVGALIELGAGFNPILSGRENIYNNGAILGFTRKEIKEKIEEIIDFAEIREFIDMPVQNYSSGMKVRLGFAVAAQMQPDVLIIDEVLAVGDLGFVLKCFKTIDTILPNTAIVFVSHSMPMVSRICNQVILMEWGEAKFQGTDVASAIDKYYSRFVNNESNLVFSDGSIKLVDKKIIDYFDLSGGAVQIKWGSDFKLYFSFEVKKDIPVPEFFIIIVDKEQRPVARFKENEKNVLSINASTNTIDFYIKHTNLQLAKGVYSVNISLRSSLNREPILRMNSILSFQIIHEDEVWEPFLLKSTFEKVRNTKLSNT